jgi:putative DNA primase/helicase
MNRADRVGEAWWCVWKMHFSAVARIYRPGVKADCCLILEGQQGLKKSTALRTLAGEWFTDEIADLGSKDTAMQTRGVWLIELAELDSLTRADVGRVKVFMSRSTDRFRPPYGKRLVHSPRQCVFAGSVNHSTYLRDETGGRRFWPVACTQIFVNDLERDRDQLWAEAVTRYRGGAIWWLDTPELNLLAEREQSDRYEGDPWDELIAAWLQEPSARCDPTGPPILPFTSSAQSVTVVDVLTHCIGKRQDQRSQSDKNRVARSLRSMGWELYKARKGEERTWRKGGMDAQSPCSGVGFRAPVRGSGLRRTPLFCCGDAALWSRSSEAVRKLFQDEPGVLVLGGQGSPHKRRYTTLRIPASVLQRVHRRMTNI